MVLENTGFPIRAAAQRHLEDNAHQMTRSNIIVHVDWVSLPHHAAFCSVEQRHRGWLWRRCSVEELTWRAEQALAPLMSMGILPMITVKHRSLRNATTSRTQRFALLNNVLGQLLGWSGLPLGWKSAATRGVDNDPFGWRSASRHPAPEGCPSIINAGAEPYPSP
jgi:hypothetical protein